MRPSHGWMDGVKVLLRLIRNALVVPTRLPAMKSNLSRGSSTLFLYHKPFTYLSCCRAGKRMSKFMQSRLKDLRRLSRAGSNLNLEHAFAAYGADPSPRSQPQSRFTDSDSESGLSERPTPRARDLQRMRSASRLRSETSSPAPRQPPPLPEQVAPLRLPVRRSPAGSSVAPSESGMPTRSVRPGSIAEIQRKYTRSPASSIDARRTHQRNESFLKLSGGNVDSDGDAASAGHW